MIEVDGSFLEGGGQILRTSLGLSSLTGNVFRVTNIRKGRCNPGLQAQHLNAVRTVQQICDADVEGVSIGSQNLTFKPGELQSQDVSVDIGTAGSITLLLQSVLMPAVFGTKESTFTIVGGTDVPWSQPYDYFKNVLLRYLDRFADCEVELTRRGYYPKGGGRITLTVKPKFSIAHFNSTSDLLEGVKGAMPEIRLTEQGELLSVQGVSHASSFLKDKQVAERQASAAEKTLKSLGCPVEITVEYSESLCPGSGISLWALFPEGDWPSIIGTDSLGKKGKKAEHVGEEAAKNLTKEIASGAAVDRYLADQLLPFMCFLPSATYRASEITAHCRTNIYVIEKFLPMKFSVKENSVSLLS